MSDSARSAAPDASTRRLGVVVLLLTCAPLAWAVAAAPKKTPPAPPAPIQATAPKAAKPAAPAAKSAKSGEVPRFTNDDLPGAASDDEAAVEVAAEAAKPPAEDAAAPKAKKSKAKAGESESGEGEEAQEFEEVLSAEESAAKTVLLQRQIADAEKRIEQLESRRRALQNPLHAGLFPAGTEEQQAVGGQGNDVRLAWVEDQIRATRHAMERDREELAQLQAPER